MRPGGTMIMIQPRISPMNPLMLALWAVLLVPGAVRAQEIGLAGTVSDSTEAVLPGVTVTALHVATGNTFVSVTDAAGAYRVTALRPGVYKITAELPGFASVIRDQLELLVG